MRRAIIRTPYNNGSATLAGIRLADVLESLGVRTRIRVVGRRRPAVSRYWDSRSYLDSTKLGSSELEVWMCSPSRQMWDAVKQPDCMRVIVDVPQSIRDFSVYSEARRVMAPNHCSHRQLYDRGVLSTYLAWDAGVPLAPRTPREQVVIPIDHDQLECLGTDEFFVQLWQLVREYPSIRWEILYPPRTGSRCKRMMRAIADVANVQELMPLDDKYWQTVADSSLCLLTNRADSFGYLMTACHLHGVPTLAWCVSPFHELSVSQRDLLAFTETAESPGRQCACNRGDAMLNKARELLQDLSSLHSRRELIQHEAENRRDHFCLFWRGVLDEL